MAQLWSSGSLGVVVVTGLTAAVVAADAATKAAVVNFVGMRRIGAGLVTLGFVGDVAAVQAAVAAAARACAELGVPAVTSVIGRPALPEQDWGLPLQGGDGR
jgi:microcompartment protein CcmL/EutN